MEIINYNNNNPSELRGSGRTKHMAPTATTNNKIRQSSVVRDQVPTLEVGCPYFAAKSQISSKMEFVIRTGEGEGHAFRRSAAIAFGYEINIAFFAEADHEHNQQAPFAQVPT